MPRTLTAPLATRRELVSELAIVAAAVLYGSTYLLVQHALERTTSPALNLARFGLGALVLVPIALRRGWRGPSPRPTDSSATMLRSGVAIGAVAFVGYLAQNVGLERTSTSNSAFITGLAVVFTPVFVFAVLGRRPRPTIVGAVIVAVGGLLLLTGSRPTANPGDVVTLVAAACFGLWFVQIAIFAPRFDVIGLVAVQAATVGALSAPLVGVSGVGELDGSVWLAVVVTGVGCTAIAFSLSTWAQRRVEASRASIINLAEPVVAGAVGFVVGERLGVGGYVGAALILFAMVVAQSDARFRRRATLPPHAG